VADADNGKRRTVNDSQGDRLWDLGDSTLISCPDPFR
jgi:hypothetical protein